METKELNAGISGENLAVNHGSSTSSSFEHIKNVVSDKLHSAARSVSEKSVSADVDALIGSYRKPASEWLDQSAEYVRQFDYDKAGARIREHVAQNPGRSLAIAGIVGVIIGAIVRHR
jgi:hypothetical protein